MVDKHIHITTLTTDIHMVGVTMAGCLHILTAVAGGATRNTTEVTSPIHISTRHQVHLAGKTLLGCWKAVKKIKYFVKRLNNSTSTRNQANKMTVLRICISCFSFV